MIRLYGRGRALNEARANQSWTVDLPWVWQVSVPGKRNEIVAVQRIDSEALTDSALSLLARKSVTRMSGNRLKILALPGTLTLTRIHASVLKRCAQEGLGVRWTALGRRVSVMSKPSRWRCSLIFDIEKPHGLQVFELVEPLGFDLAQKPAPNQIAFSKQIGIDPGKRTTAYRQRIDTVLKRELAALAGVLGHERHWRDGSFFALISIEPSDFATVNLEFSCDTVCIIADLGGQIVLDYA